MRTTAALLGLASLALGVVALPRLLWQGTASLPRGLYWQRPLTQVRRGMLVVADLPPAWHALAVARGYLAPGQPVLKPVAAIPGDTACHRDGVVFRKAERLGAVAATDRAGRALPQWAGCQTLGEDVFLLSPAPQSFDSRYVGSVAIRALRGEGVPLWTTRDGRSPPTCRPSAPSWRR